MQDNHPYSEAADDGEIHEIVEKDDSAYEEFLKAWLKKSLDFDDNPNYYEYLEAYEDKIGVDEKYLKAYKKYGVDKKYLQAYREYHGVDREYLQAYREYGVDEEYLKDYREYGVDEEYFQAYEEYYRKKYWAD